MSRSLIASLFLTPASFADEYTKNLDTLASVVRTNPLTRNGYWLEMKNAFGDWEKMILVFGYADPGDEAACITIEKFAAAENPKREFRCNPVN